MKSCDCPTNPCPHSSQYSDYVLWSRLPVEFAHIAQRRCVHIRATAPTTVKVGKYGGGSARNIPVQINKGEPLCRRVNPRSLMAIRTDVMDDEKAQRVMQVAGSKTLWFCDRCSAIASKYIRYADAEASRAALAVPPTTEGM